MNQKNQRKKKNQKNPKNQRKKKTKKKVFYLKINKKKPKMILEVMMKRTKSLV